MSTPLAIIVLIGAWFVGGFAFSYRSMDRDEWWPMLGVYIGAGLAVGSFCFALLVQHMWWDWPWRFILAMHVPFVVVGVIFARWIARA